MGTTMKQKIQQGRFQGVSGTEVQLATNFFRVWRHSFDLSPIANKDSDCITGFLVQFGRDELGDREHLPIPRRLQSHHRQCPDEEGDGQIRARPPRHKYQKPHLRRVRYRNG